ncbi:hypothetical protein [Nostocoides sp. HKS02]|uniref:hypothetical protein n=1 Tax=Nostocoides sp. HKS02 TaxID=1813880 RepID=UPI0012B4B89D|nr:hypothetical protein [Tetrasphaera sp. HKS02]QGN59029.1 hypothetical protein GKE56_15345 [Tetrasphaera sp. HKS02]
MEYAVGKADREGLSLGYRLMYRLKRMIMQMYGPAQLGEGDDPLARLQRERDAKVAAARAERAGRGRPA